MTKPLPFSKSMIKNAALVAVPCRNQTIIIGGYSRTLKPVRDRAQKPKGKQRASFVVATPAGSIIIAKMSMKTINGNPAPGPKAAIDPKREIAGHPAPKEITACNE